MGATGDTDGRAAFDVFFRTLLEGGLLEKDLQELLPKVCLVMPLTIVAAALQMSYDTQQSNIFQSFSGIAILSCIPWCMLPD